MRKQLDAKEAQQETLKLEAACASTVQSDVDALMVRAATLEQALAKVCVVVFVAGVQSCRPAGPKIILYVGRVARSRRPFGRGSPVRRSLVGHVCEFVCERKS